MLSFNNLQYHDALKVSGLSSDEDPYYKELITSEINYINNFLNYLNEEDIETLLSVYTSKKYKHSENDMSKDSFRYLYNSLNQIQKMQMDVLSALYQGDPLLWQTAICKLSDSYIHYISIRQGLMFPKLLEEKFKQIQIGKIAQGFPEIGSLDSIFISPIQRLPRYALLGRELSKDTEKKLQNKSSEALITFGEKLAAFNLAMSELNQKINHAIANPLTSETLNQFLRAPLVQEKQISDEEPTSPYLRPSGIIKPRLKALDVKRENTDDDLTNKFSARKRTK